MQALTANISPVPEQISKVRASYGHSIALSYRDRQMSYEELDRRTDRFAGHLVHLGIAPGGTVAICMERSFDWIVAALGIMRAGAAYVPLDLAWPDSRLRFAVKDSGATVLVARAALLDGLRVKARGIDPSRDAAAIAATLEVEHGPIQPESLAYVIYTSGSTGVPKGVEITHANLVHLIRWHVNAFNVTRRDRASHLAGLGFDAAVWEIWPHLSAGATVCLADDMVRSSPDLMQEWMIREHVTIGFVPTIHATPMMAMEWPAATALRFLLTGGDTLHHAPSVHLPFEVVNNYGPTECTVVATSSVIKPGSPGAPPIGGPIAGTSVYLLNEDGEQVLDGSTGEIYIGGGGVGRGYRNLTDSTERSFLPDPFGGAQCARMYRTGDRGSRRPDGEIEFRGRLDRQTKIRGQRVELDEIGSILTHHQSIDFATAIAISQGGENQLVAYVLPKKNARIPTVHELQKHLLRSLPDYMIPATFVRLHELPLSANGKLDLTRLPQLTEAHLLEGMAARAPANPIEEKLLTMVRQVLQNDALVAQDSFLLAGGHSLLGMQLLMRLRNEFGMDLTLQQIFEAPTVESLALLVEATLINAIDSMSAQEAETPTKFGQRIPVAELLQTPTVRHQAELVQRRTKDKPVLPPGVLALQPSGARNGIFWLHYPGVELAKVIGDDQPLLAVALTAEDVASLGEMPTLKTIATCLLGKILSVQSKGPYTIGGFCLGGILAYEIASQLRAAGHEVALLVLLDAPNPAYLQSCDSHSLTRKVSYLRYALKRAARLALRMSLIDLGVHLHQCFPRAVRTRFARTEVSEAQVICEAAAFAYRPEKYEGNVLLLLASDRPSHVNYLLGWQAVVPRDLHTQWLDGNHCDLLKSKNVRRVADAIISHLVPATDDETLSGRLTLPNHRGLCKRGTRLEYRF